MPELLSPADGAVVSLHSEVTREFIRRTKAGLLQKEDDYAWLAELRDSGYAIGDPKTLLFRWKCDDSSVAAKFELSLNPEFSPCDRLGGIATMGVVCVSAEGEGEYFLCADNLLRNTTYYWRVNGGACRRFTTADEIRLLRVDGSGNVRDLGGGKTADGYRIKQGCVYRGGGLEKGYTWYELTARGKYEMEQTLAVRTEIDLRGDVFGKLTSSPIGERVAYELLPISAYGGVFNATIAEDHIRPKADVPCEAEGFAAFRRIFELLADKSNYPIYFHCTAGADRTGTLAMLIEAVLGVSPEDMYIDYVLTRAFYGQIWNDKQPAEFFDGLNERYPGRSLAEQMTALLTDMGITADTFRRIRENLLE